jgi:beta-aspartyl-peptidase (threonine type)
MMRVSRLLILYAVAAPALAAAQTGLYSGGAPSGGARAPTIAIHAGSGTLTRANITPEVESKYRASIARALAAGMAELDAGRSSLDAVVAAIIVMEDDPLFNAGKGAVFTSEGRNELDAAIMDGRSGMAGAVAGVTTVKNPILAARAVMEKTRHVMLAGAGADKFAQAQKLEIVEPSYFFTQHRWDQLQRAKDAERIELDHDGAAKAKSSSLDVDSKYGTVGAVALDKDGNLAAATSTGGLTNKLYGRIGDSPIVGAGTYADNRTVAISGTGTGEFFMRGLVAYDVSARMKYLKLGLADAVDATLREALEDKKGRGGVIAMDKDGNVRWGFNTEGMYRGYVRTGATPTIEIFR